MLSYHKRLYEQYVLTHFSLIRDISLESIERMRPIFRAYFGEFLPESKNAKILDVGCGFGSFLYFLDKEGYQEILGVDISEEQVETAKRLGISSVSCEDLMVYLEKHKNHFDCISALDVVEHLSKEEVLPFLDIVFEALKPGGTFLIQAPNGASPLSGIIRYSDFTHEIALSDKSANQLLRVVGFVDVQVFPTGPVVHGFMSACRWMLWRGFHFFIQLYLVAETGVFRGHILTQNLIGVARKPKSKEIPL